VTASVLPRDRIAGKVLAFRHVPFEHLGWIADSLASRGLAFEYVDLSPGGSPPDIGAAAGLIFMGGPMSANDDLPYLRRELDLIVEAVALGKPLLGVCLGSQLIAKALGARVYANRVKEIGWYPVYWTDAAAEDLRLSTPEIVFHWHGETFDLPPGAELLAYSVACPHQAYRVGKNVYGFQFHLEVTPEMIADWLAQDANCGDLREIASPIDPHAHADRLKELAAQVFGHWCGLARRE
jgi:GMP synthase-like glutamine amidotransferase